MIIIQDKLVSDDVIKKQFKCNLNACKGACCIEGDTGAPLEEEERNTLEEIYSIVEPYLTEEGKQAIEEQGKSVYFPEAEEFGTPLIGGGPCAYLNFSEDGIVMCGIEQAYFDGKIEFRKPISCQLYPIRVEKNETVGFEALNYDIWDICSAACQLGKEEQLPIYQFLKDALTRKYGKEFFDELDSVAKQLE